MPTTTRSTARSPSGNEEQRSTPARGTTSNVEERKYDGETYFPIYCLTNVPNEYFEELQRYANIVTDVPLIEVTSTKTDRFQALEEMQALNRNSASESPLPYPFHGNSVDQVYQDFQARLSPPLYSGALEPFTYNTFAVVDIDCVISRPWKCVVCTDAIAFVEGEPHEELKQLRMPLGEELCTALGTIEAMVVAPNEVHDSQGQPYWPSP